MLFPLLFPESVIAESNRNRCLITEDNCNTEIMQITIITFHLNFSYLSPISCTKCFDVFVNVLKSKCFSNYKLPLPICLHLSYFLITFCSLLLDVIDIYAQI